MWSIFFKFPRALPSLGGSRQSTASGSNPQQVPSTGTAGYSNLVLCLRNTEFWFGVKVIWGCFGNWRAFTHARRLCAACAQLCSSSSSVCLVAPTHTAELAEPRSQGRMLGAASPVHPANIPATQLMENRAGLGHRLFAGTWCPSVPELVPFLAGVFTSWCRSSSRDLLES